MKHDLLYISCNVCINIKANRMNYQPHNFDFIGSVMGHYESPSVARIYHHMMHIQPTHTHTHTLTQSHSLTVTRSMQPQGLCGYSEAAVQHYIILSSVSDITSLLPSSHSLSVTRPAGPYPACYNCPRSWKDSDGIRHSKACGHSLRQGQATMVDQLLDNDFQQWCFSILTIHWLKLSQKSCL